MNLPVLLLVAGAGSLGAICRYLAVLATHYWSGPTPWSIAIVNIAGCFGFGCCWSLGQARWPAHLAAAVLVGFFGAFTTFSSYVLDCHVLLVERRYLLAFANAVLQNTVGMLALMAGIALCSPGR